MASLNFNSSKPKNKKLKKFFLLLIIVCGLVYLVSVVLSKFKNDTEIVKVNDEIIYEKQIMNKIALAFGSNKAEMPQIKDLPRDVVEAFAKEIYLEEKIIEQAKKSDVTRKPEVKELLRQSRNRILIDAYIQDRIEKNITDEKIKQKYAEVTAKSQGKREYDISYVVIEDEKDAAFVYRVYNETYPSQKPRRFSELAKKYSIDKETANNGGKLGYVMEDDLPKEISEEVLAIKDAGYTNPIGTESGWYIVVVKDVRDVQVPPFEEAYEILKNKIIKNTTDEIYEEVFHDVKIEFYLPKKEELKKDEQKQ